jgi:hypothetical protein
MTRLIDSIRRGVPAGLEEIAPSRANPSWSTRVCDSLIRVNWRACARR